MKRQYVVIFEQAEGNVCAYIPELPGCISTGEDFETCRKNIVEAMELHLEGMFADGDKIPKSTAFRADLVGVSIPELQATE